MIPRIEMALMKKGIRSLRTGDGFRVGAILGGRQASDPPPKGQDITRTAAEKGDSGKRKEIHAKCSTPAMQGIGDVWELQPREECLKCRSLGHVRS